MTPALFLNIYDTPRTIIPGLVEVGAIRDGAHVYGYDSTERVCFPSLRQELPAAAVLAAEIEAWLRTMRAALMGASHRGNPGLNAGEWHDDGPSRLVTMTLGAPNTPPPEGTEFRDSERGIVPTRANILYVWKGRLTHRSPRTWKQSPRTLLRWVVANGSPLDRLFR